MKRVEALGIDRKRQAGCPDPDLGMSPALIHGLITLMEKKRRKLMTASVATLLFPFSSLPILTFQTQLLEFYGQKSQGEGREGKQSENTFC